MLNTNIQLQISEYEGLYNRLIPQSHILRQINELVDFSFVFDELRDKYCPDNGRNAEDPIRLFKYLLLKCMYRMSDNDLVERSMYDMSYKYFLDYRPEDIVISPSLLTKFRKLRLVDEGIMDKLINKSVEIAIRHGIIKSKNVIVDSTHTPSRYHNRKPHEVLQDQARRLRREVYQVDERMKEKFPAKIQGDDIEEHIEYCQKLLEAIESDKRMMLYEKVKLKSNFLREMIEDNLEHLYTSADKDAKVGHKSADTSFFGYKTHIAMTDEGIITAATVTSGEKHDGKQLVSLKEGCKSKTYSVALTSDIQKEHKEFQDSARFKELSSHRYKIEAKNGELKNRLGYAKAYSFGIQAMQIQGATTLFAANLKRIIRIMNEKR